MSSNISQIPSSEIRYSSGIGSVVILKEELMSRDKYITDCYKNGWVSIYIENEGIRDRVLCDMDNFNWIYFPEKYEQLGSTVVWVFDQLKGQIYITSVISGGPSYEHASEHDFRFIRRLGDAFVELRGNPKDKMINISVHSEEESELNISVTDNIKKSKMNVSVNGELLVKTNQKTTFFTHGSFKVEVENEEDETIKTLLEIYEQSVREESKNRMFNIWERVMMKVADKAESSRMKTSIFDVFGDKAVIRTNKFDINTGKEKMILGDTLSLFLEDLVTEMSNITVVTSLGRVPVVNKREIASFVMRLRNLVSRHANLS